jgi:hypothetical protein
LEAVQSISQDFNPADLSIGEVRNKLAGSLKDFSTKTSIAIKRLYAGPKRAKEIHRGSDLSGSENEGLLDIENGSLPEGPNETVFLIYL